MPNPNFRNDSVWFCKFDWGNCDNVAQRVQLDICWQEAGGNTFIFLDALLENGLYVTIGLRQEKNGAQKASMSIFKHSAPMSLFEKIQLLPGKGFLCRPGGEGDKYCKGDYPFKFREFYQLVINSKEGKIKGSIHQLSAQKITEIGNFLTGENSLIKAQTPNSMALEHYGMENPCKYKSQIIIKNPLRVDINKFCSSAQGGIVRYQKCPNVNIATDSDRRIILTHGGDTVKSNMPHNGYLSW